MTGFRTFAFVQQKGGTGKTVSVCWLAWMLSRGHRVAVIDLDPQGGATTFLGTGKSYQYGAYDLIVGGDIPKDAIVRSKISNCMLVPATDTLIMAEMDARVQSLDFNGVHKRLTKTFKAFDYVIIDCGSGLGILTSLAMSISDQVIIPLPEGELEKRARNATYRHLSRMRRNAVDIAVTLPTMRRSDKPVVTNWDDDVLVSSVAVPVDDSISSQLFNLSNAVMPDPSNPIAAAYFALAHELSGNEWQPDEMPDLEEPEEPLETDTVVKSRPRPLQSSITEPRAETMTDIFDALHEKRSKQDDGVVHEKVKPSKPPLPKGEQQSEQSRVPHEQNSPTSALPRYQSLRDIHHDTLEEAPKVRTWFWLRLGLALIGIGIAIIGIFTNLIGPLVMWGAVIAVLILIIPDLILKFVLKDR